MRRKVVRLKPFKSEGYSLYFNSKVMYNNSIVNVKGKIMKGSIRALVGFLLAYGAVGGMETGSPLIPTMALAVAGLAVMASGVFAMKGNV